MEELEAEGGKCCAKKFKGRVVFQGDRVIDQNFDAAMFQDLGSSPATMEAAKIADFFGCVPGHSLEIADAVQAYLQAEMNEGHSNMGVPAA